MVSDINTPSTPSSQPPRPDGEPKHMMLPGEVVGEDPSEVSTSLLPTPPPPRTTQGNMLDSEVTLRAAWLQPPVALSIHKASCFRGSVTAPVLEESQLEENEVLSYEGILKPFIGRPSSPLRLAWDVAGAFLIFYDLFVIPLGAFDLPDSNLLTGMGWVTLIFWTLNVGSSLTTGYLGPKGVVVMDPRLIAKHYLKSWFCVDLIVVVPDWIFTLMPEPEEEGQETSSGNGDQIKLLRMLRLVRMTRLLRLLKLRKLGEIIDDNIDSEYLSIVASISKMIMLLIIINHIIACIWWSVGTMGGGSNTWIRQHEFHEVNWDYQYTTSFHWSITQFTPSSMSVQPQNVFERVFAIAVVVFALVGFSYVVGSITGSLTQLRAMQEEASKQFWTLRRYLKQHQVQSDLKKRIQRYLEHAWARKGATQPARSFKIFELLSEQLMSELQYELSEKYLVIHPLFGALKQSSPVSMQRLANSGISQKQLARGDQLFQANEVAKELYIVSHGRFEYHLASRGTTFGDGVADPELVDAGQDWISEPVLWMQAWLHKGVLAAILESELMLVNPDKFTTVMQQNPDSLVITTRYAKNFCEWIAAQDLTRISDIFQGGPDEDAYERHMRFMEIEGAAAESPLQHGGPFGLTGHFKKRFSEQRLS